MGIKDVIENEFSPQNREGTMVGAVTAPHPYWIANILVANTPSVVAIFLDARPSASRLPDPPPAFVPPEPAPRRGSVRGRDSVHAQLRRADGDLRRRT